MSSDNTLVTSRGRFSATTSLARTLAGTASSRSVRWLEDPEGLRSRSASRPGGDRPRHRRRLCPTRWSSVATALEVYLLRQVHLMERVEAWACEPGYSSWGSSGGEADPKRGPVLALQHALDGPPAGERTYAQGPSARHGWPWSRPNSSDSWHCLCREPADGEDGPLQFGSNLGSWWRSRVRSWRPRHVRPALRPLSQGYQESNRWE